ncbi:MAG: hypothetical protein HY433_01250 [Candidatus Liptonbacteria bacterium]|nr:hypothetical protein [Candidatus Liptonbacteria bacterium]
MQGVKRIFFIPPGSSARTGKHLLEDLNLVFLDKTFFDFFRERGMELYTIDAWRPESHNDKEDALAVFNHPDEGFLLRAFYYLKFAGKGRGKYSVDKKTLNVLLGAFSRKILFQAEPPIVMPWPYRHMKKLKKEYSSVFSTIHLESEGVKYFILPYNYTDRFGKNKIGEHFDAPKEKFLVMINSNARPHGYFKYELYSERLRAIKYFCDKPGFDLYGVRWDRKPFLHWSYAPYVKKVWRGSIPGDNIESKLPTLAMYKFTLLFENSTFPGYVDIKLLDPLVTGTVPVYLGAPDIANYIPKGCFIDMRDFRTYNELEKYLRAMSDTERERYRSNIRDFFRSEQAKVFTPRYFAEVVHRAVQEVF